MENLPKDSQESIERVHLSKKESGDSLSTLNFLLMDNDQVVGELQLRPIPTKSSVVPAGFENHIYYEIYPEYRGKGYGTKILDLGLQEAKKIGLKEVILTCEETNINSQKIIEANGGELLDKQLSTEGELFRKYTITF